jgi:hypothetical protein
MPTSSNNAALTKLISISQASERFRRGDEAARFKSFKISKDLLHFIIGGILLRKFSLILAFTLILMPIATLASDSFSEDLNLQKDLTLKSFDFEPKYVKNDGSVNFLATIYAKNGLNANKSMDFATQAVFLRPHSFWPFWRGDRMNVTFSPTPILGDMKNGTYEGTKKVPAKIGHINSVSSEGVWQLTSIKLVDSSGNVRELKGDDLSSFPKELYVEVGPGRWIMNLLVIPIIFFGILYGIYSLTQKKLNKKSIQWIWKGYDGATSSSKFQFFLWTLVILYAYIIMITDAYFNHSSPNLGLTVPQNLMLAMGLSATTMLAAKGITSEYTGNAQLDKSDTSKGGLFFDDDGYPDLSKIQLISWTFIGIGIFLLTTLNDVMGSSGAPTGLPDIDSTILVLMGIGEGAYIGKKITTKDDPAAPKLNSIKPDEGGLDQEITVTGTNFEKDAQRIVTIGGKKVQFKKGNESIWKDGMVRFKLADIESISGESLDKILKEGAKVEIGVIIGNRSSIIDIPFTIKKTDPAAPKMNPEESQKKAVGGNGD